MNGLVGYGSSDEEEGESSNVVLQSQSTAVETNAIYPVDAQKLEPNGGHVDTQLTTAPVQGPTTGPNRTASDEYELEGYEDDHNSSAVAVPEQDMLRHLTQPSHPVTSFPPEPEGQADAQVTAKIKNFLELKKKGIHFNENLADKNSFNNPNLFATLLDRLGVPPEAQYSSSLPSEVFCVDMFPSWAYKEELLRSQQQIDAQNSASKKSQSTAGRRTIQFTTSSIDSQPLENDVSETQIKRKRP